MSRRTIPSRTLRCHDNLVGQAAVEVDRLDIHLVQLEVTLGGDSKDRPGGSKFCDRYESLVINNAFKLWELALRKALGNDACFIFLIEPLGLHLMQKTHLLPLCQRLCSLLGRARSHKCLSARTRGFCCCTQVHEAVPAK